MKECASPAMRNTVSISGREAAIHEGHLQFVLVVGNGADAAHDDTGSALGCVVHQQAVEGNYFGIGDALDHFLQHFDAFFDAEERLLFVVAQDGDDELVE